MNAISWVIFVIFFISPFVAIGLFISRKKKLKQNIELESEIIGLKSKITNLEQKYAPIVSAEQFLFEIENKQHEVEQEIQQLKSSYQEKKQVYDRLINELAIFDEQMEMIENGFYQPHFKFGTSEEFKEKITQVRNQQKQLIKEKKAVICSTKWTVNGSTRDGSKMTNRQIKLLLRAFNNECDAAIASTTWKNALRMEARIKKSFADMNKISEVNCIFITGEYLSLKLEEFYLAHEYAEKCKQEMDERAELRQQAREAAKFEQELLEAQKEEEKYHGLLEKAKRDATEAQGAKLEALQRRIEQLTRDLNEAKEQNIRATSMAQQTRAGYVYVISNIGSFGKDIYKIGMTRRLDPMDRVRELGDASIPFGFDVHAMIYSEDAPQLENQLHKAFADKRLNLKNIRREFFSATLEEIEEVVRKTFPDASFIKDVEAQDYYESLALRESLKNNSKNSQNVSQFPDEI